MFFGNDEIQKQGTTKITRTIFAGTQDREENALIFLDNLDKVQRNNTKKLTAGKAGLDDLNASFDTSNQTDAEVSTLNDRK